MSAQRLLRELARSPDLQPFRGLVWALVEHDRERRSDLVRTLRAYFAAGSNASEAADRMFLHRNSMLYRLARIQELTGLDLKDRTRASRSGSGCWRSREEKMSMKLSTRNRLPGTITEVVKGEAAAKVTLQVGDNHVVALITRESADELGLEPGKEVTALVKATDVMILTDDGVA